MKQLGKWMNAIADAYNRGEADWAYPDGTSEAMRVWRFLDERYSFPEAEKLFIEWAQHQGITLKKHKPR